MRIELHRITLYIVFKKIYWTISSDKQDNNSNISEIKSLRPDVSSYLLQ